MPPKYQGVVFQRGKGRGRGRGLGKGEKSDQFSDTELDNARERMENRGGDEQLRQNVRDPLLEELVRSNQQMMAQNQ